MPQKRFVIDSDALQKTALDHAKNVLKNTPFDTENFDDLMREIMLQIAKAYVIGYLKRDSDGR